VNNVYAAVALALGVTTLFLSVVVFRLWAAGKGTAITSSTPLELQAFVKPLVDSLTEVQRKLDESRLDATKHQSSLLGEMGKIMLVNGKLERQNEDLKENTTKISAALTNATMTADWGELQLERTVELAKLTEHVSWVSKEMVKAEHRNIYPDLIVRLPNSRNVVVDAKAPKIDIHASQSDSEGLADALRAHIIDLSGRDYSTWVSDAVDFVVLFVPTEGILANALKQDPTLAEDAINLRVLLASPMTLLALLRAVQFGWKQLEQTRNASEIVEASKNLVNSLVGLAERFNVVANGLRTAVKNYNDAASYLENTVNSRARDIREMGVTSVEVIDAVVAPETIVRDVNWK
jgi:DNA recombination protein RmuC